MHSTPKLARAVKILAARVKSIILFHLCLCLILLDMSAPGRAQAEATRRKALIIYSFDDLLPWQANVRAGLRERLEQIAPEDRPDIYEERIDALRVDAAGSDPAFTAYLKARYGAVRFDAVIAESAEATRFLLNHPDLFVRAERIAVDPVGSVPLGLNDSGIRLISAQGDWAKAALHTVAAVMPDIARLIAIVDPSSAVGATNRASLLAAAAILPAGQTLEIWDHFSFDELFERAADLAPGAALLYSPVFQDRSGARRTPRDVVRDLARVANAPVFAHHDTFLGVGIVGGRLLSSRREGEMIADLALGPGFAERWADAEAQLNPMVFDAAALQHWQIPTHRLPPAYRLINENESVWGRYRWQIGAAFAALSLEGLLILWLITALRQRKEAILQVMRERDGLELRVTQRTAELLAATRRLEENNQRLEDLASTDALTGAANRRKFIKVAEAELAAAHHDARPLSLLMIDADAFKAINDRHGHAAGDRVLCVLAQLCRTALREADCLGRIGGEEFAILLPGLDLGAATAVAERLRALTCEALIDAGTADPLRVTVSIGVGTLDAAPDSLKDMMARADAALYQAKAQGRNRVVGQLLSHDHNALAQA